MATHSPIHAPTINHLLGGEADACGALDCDRSAGALRGVAVSPSLDESRCLAESEYGDMTTAGFTNTVVAVVLSSFRVLAVNSDTESEDGNGAYACREWGSVWSAAIVVLLSLCAMRSASSRRS